VPGWNMIAGAAQTTSNTNANTGVGTNPAKPAYVYVPVAIDPATGAYTALPAQIQKDGTALPVTNLPQQEVPDYSTMTPAQILVPEGQKPPVDTLADKTAGLLQRVSQKSIRWVVSLFDAAGN